MKKNEILIVGKGQLSDLAKEIIERQKKFSFAGYLKPENEKELIYKRKKIKNVFIALGNSEKRFILYKKLKRFNFIFPVIIDPSAIILTKLKNIGEGSMVGVGSKILQKTIIGKQCIIGTSVTILHDVIINDNCLLGGKSTIGSNVHISKNVDVGVGAIISSSTRNKSGELTKINIGKNSHICSGSVVLKSFKSNSKIIGNPGKIIP